MGVGWWQGPGAGHMIPGMTENSAQQPGPRPPFDIGNPVLGPGPFQMDLTPSSGASGPCLIVTVRTSSATVTGFVTRDQAEEFGRLFGMAAAQLPVSGLIVPSRAPLTAQDMVFGAGHGPQM